MSKARPIRFDNLTKLTLLTFFSLLFFYAPVMTLFLQERGLSLWQINSLWSAILISSFLAEIPTGLIADRIGRKRSILIALLLQFFGKVLFIFSQNYGVLLCVSVLSGIGFAFSSGALEAFLFDDLKARNREHDMTWAMGRLSAGGRAGNIVSALIGGVLATNLALTTANFQIMISMTAAALTIALFLAFRLDESDQSEMQDQSEEDGFFVNVKAGWQQIVSSSLLIGFALILIFSNSFSDYLLNLYQPYFVISRVSAVWLGWAPAAGAFLGIFVAINAWRLKQQMGHYRAVLLAIILPAFFYFGMAWQAQPIWAVIMVIGFIASIQLSRPLMSELINQHIDSNSRATTLSLINMGATIYEAAMGFALGSIADRTLSGAFWVMGGVIVFATAIAWLLFLKLKET